MDARSVVLGASVPRRSAPEAQAPFVLAMLIRHWLRGGSAVLWPKSLKALKRLLEGIDRKFSHPLDNVKRSSGPQAHNARSMASPCAVSAL